MIIILMHSEGILQRLCGSQIYNKDKFLSLAPEREQVCGVC